MLRFVRFRHPQEHAEGFSIMLVSSCRPFESQVLTQLAIDSLGHKLPDWLGSNPGLDLMLRSLDQI